MFELEPICSARATGAEVTRFRLNHSGLRRTSTRLTGSRDSAIHEISRAAAREFATIAETLAAERPNVDKLLLALDAGEVRRGARFIGEGGGEGVGKAEKRGRQRSQPSRAFADARERRIARDGCGNDVSFHTRGGESE